MAVMKRKVKRTEYAIHPFSQEKLAVLDSFLLKDLEHIHEGEVGQFQCHNCNGNESSKIQVIDSGFDTLPYYAVNCTSCLQSKWYLLPKESER